MLEEKEVLEAYNHIEVCDGLIINLKCCISTFVCNDDVMACVVIEVKHLSSDKHTNTTEDANTKKHTYKHRYTNTNLQLRTHKYNSTNTNHTSFIASKLPPNKYRNTNTQIQMKISAEIEIFAMMTWSAAAVS